MGHEAAGALTGCRATQNNQGDVMEQTKIAEQTTEFVDLMQRAQNLAQRSSANAMAKATGPGIPNCAISNTAKGMMIGGLDREVEVSVRRACARRRR